MAEELAKEILSQSRSMGYAKSALAFKFEQEGGSELFLQTLTMKGSLKTYLVTIKDSSDKAPSVMMYRDKESLYELIEAYTGIDGSTAAYRCNDVSTSFRLVSLNGRDEKVITEFVHNASPVRNDLDFPTEVEEAIRRNRDNMATIQHRIDRLTEIEMPQLFQYHPAFGPPLRPRAERSLFSTSTSFKSFLDRKLPILDAEQI